MLYWAAIICGAAVGVAGIIPVVFATRQVDATTKLPLLRAVLAVLASVSIIMAGLLGSVVVLLLIKNSYEHFFIFTTSVCIAYVLTVIIFAIAKLLEMRHENRERR